MLTNMPEPTSPYLTREEPMEDEISLLDLAITLAKHKKLILGAPLLAAVVVAVFMLFMPNIYTADTQIMPPQQQSSASAMLNQLGALSGVAGAAGIKNPNDVYIAMLKSRTLQESMIRRFKLQNVYATKTPGVTRKTLAGVTTITSGKDGLITVQVDDKNPQRAAMLANGYAEALQQMTQVFAVTEASKRRLFFEKQLLQSKEALSDAEIALKRLQEKTGIIQLDAQAQLIISTAAGLKGQIAMREVELGAMRTFATGNNPDYIRTQQVLAGLREQLAKVETGTVTTSKVPETGLEYIRKVRDLKYAETIYEMLAKQFEMAKIDEAKESSVIQVLDKAVVPEQKSKPARSKTVLLAAVATGFLAILWAFITEALQNAKKESETVAQLNKLKQNLRWN
jgi:tyrosine-protein kinase Etk/Wzc